jgi:4'-phosphopantetheinyl transferase
VPLADLVERGASVIHLWRVSLRAEADRVAQLLGLLSHDEQKRALRLVTRQLACRFTICRAAVRTILADYLSLGPSDVTFLHGPRGKPYLRSAGDENKLMFNVSHSGDLALVAVAMDREVGVDVEQIRPIRHVRNLVDRCLGRSERRAFLARDEADRVKLFLRYWTHKEAYLKALGEGLRIPLADVQFDVSTRGPKTALELADRGRPIRNNVYVEELCPQDGFCGAVAVEGAPAGQVRWWSWYA